GSFAGEARDRLSCIARGTAQLCRLVRTARNGIERQGDRNALQPEGACALICGELRCQILCRLVRIHWKFTKQMGSRGGFMRRGLKFGLPGSLAMLCLLTACHKPAPPPQRPPPA